MDKKYQHFQTINLNPSKTPNWPAFEYLCEKNPMPGGGFAERERQWIIYLLSTITTRWEGCGIFVAARSEALARNCNIFKISVVSSKKYLALLGFRPTVQANTSETAERESLALIITSNMSSSDLSSPMQRTKSGSIAFCFIVKRRRSATRPLLTPYGIVRQQTQFILLEYASVHRDILLHSQKKSLHNFFMLPKK